MAINFSGEIARLIAKPSIGDGIPLYVRVDNEIDGDYSNKELEIISKVNSGRYQTYNSPGNLKILFITEKGVKLNYHCGVKGANNTSLNREYSYNEKLGNMEHRKGMLEAAGGILAGANEVKKIAKSMGAEDSVPDLRGYGLGGLVRPWVYQNIEEIYFDWLPMACYDKSGSMDITSIGGSNILQIISSMVLDSMVDDGEIETLRKRFPRLHTVGVVTDLENVYSNNKDKLKKESEISKIGVPWVDKVNSGSKDTSYADGGYAVWRIMSNRKWLMESSVKSGIYKFDGEVLDPYFKGIMNKYNDEYMTNKEDIGKNTRDKQQLEIKLDKIEEILGLTTARNTLLVAIANKEVSKEWLLKSMTKDGLIKYDSIINKIK